MTRKIKIIFVAIIFSNIFALAEKSFAAPSISKVSGTISHGQNITITGSGFNEKIGAQSPTVWDDCSGINILNKWDGYWPNAAGASYNLNYRTPVQVGRNILFPHSNISKYMCGAHYPGSDATSGTAVMVWKNRTISSYPAYTYASWYQRSDDNWKFGLGNPADDNYKCFDFSRGDGPYGANYGGTYNWYLEYNGRPTSSSSDASWHYNDDDGNLMDPDNNNCNSWGNHVPDYDYRCWDNDATNPMGGHWAKIEVEIAYTNQNNGYIKLWDNGKLSLNYSGSTDKMPGTDRTEAIGGYARSYPNINNWRYFADIYLDYSRQRVLIGNAPTLDASTTLREVQIPSAWSNTSITVKVNQGGFSDGQSAYLYVFDQNGTPSDQDSNSANGYQGYPITFSSGSEGDITAPLAPSGLAVN